MPEEILAFFIIFVENKRFMHSVRLIFFLLGFVAGSNAIAQSLIPFERIRNLNIENYPERNTLNPHTSVKPFAENDFITAVNPDSALTPGCRQNGDGRSWFIRKVFYEHFLKTSKGDFYISADPLFDFQAGYDLNDKGFIYRNSRGLQISGGVGNKIAFYTNYLETQARFSSYINDYINQFEVVPGMNRVKNFNGNSYDYGVSNAYVSYSPHKVINLQLGYGKNSFGNGYRSLLLSDNAFQYPFLKITTKVGRFEYVNLFTSFQNLDSDSVINAPYVWYNGYQKKGGTFNYLSANVTKWLQIGFFEGVIWKARELKGKTFNINQFIPVIFLNTIRYSLFSENNVVIGINANARPLKKLHVYGQFALDDFHFKKPTGNGYQKTKLGYQVGIKWFDVGGLENLIFQAEYNQVRPYTYAHHDPLQSYTHNNQPLAHPLGANFREILCFVDYRYRRIYCEAQFNYSKSGGDYNDSHWGSNIFYSDTRAERGYNSMDNYTGQGINNRLICAGLRAGYLFNPKYHLCFEGGLWYRNLNNPSEIKNNLSIWIGLRTVLFNQYFDM